MHQFARKLNKIIDSRNQIRASNAINPGIPFPNYSRHNQQNYAYILCQVKALFKPY